MVDVICSECGWTGRREPEAGYDARVASDDFQPGEVFDEWYGDCPRCGEALTFHLDPTLRAMAEIRR
jgi:hypothetical protein